MHFLYPNFLIALLTISIPILIHLFGFRKFKKKYFSNVAFLKEIEVQKSAKRNLQNILILLARVLAILFLVLAFAMPYFDTRSDFVKNQNNIVSIYIDNSFSMETIHTAGNLLDEAKRNAKKIAKSFHINDKFHLLTNDFEGKHQRLLNLEDFLSQVDEVKISSMSRNLQEVVKRQETIFSGQGNYHNYIISDFQTTFTGNQSIQSPKKIKYSFVKLSPKSIPNVAIDSVWFLSPTHKQNASEKLIVRLHNYGEKSVENVPIKLTINAQQKAIGSLNLKAGAQKTDTLFFGGLKLGWQKATVSIKDYPLTFDDELKFAFNVKSNIKILVLSGENQEKYLNKLFLSDDYFLCTEMLERNINYNDFDNYQLIILNGLKQPSTGLAAQLNKCISNGTSVVCFPNVDGEIEHYNSFLNQINLPTIRKVSNELAKVNFMEIKNSIFKDVFEGEFENIDLPEAYQYFEFEDAKFTNQEKLFQLSKNRLFFSKFPKGEANLYVCATGLNAKFSNLAKHPLWVPLMYKIALNSEREPSIFYTIGKNNSLESNQKGDVSSRKSLQLKGNNFEIIPEFVRKNGKNYLYVADQVKDAGFYNLMDNNQIAAIYAFNQNKDESDRHFSDKDEIYKLFTSQNKSFFDLNKDSISSKIIVENKGIDLWKLCLILSIIFLGIEIILINYFNTTKIKN
ncbi:MAG: BatA domain-containing protein [Sphingobacteriaceae bacterium]|nr:BatA domain-containing protein [Sphingobacteriaceae bacterium]